MNKKRVVVMGGGTGTHTVLTGLKKYADEFSISAIVAMTDSGGSTGRLRDEFGYLPVGDVRMALVALARETEAGDILLRQLFLHRFKTNGDFSGHNFGNLFLVALTDILGSEEKAIEAASRVLNIVGTVIPVTKTSAQLIARYDDGSVVVGEHGIDEPRGEKNGKHIASLHIDSSACVSESASRALREADLIILGPGDLYTSIIANCVISGVPEVLTSAPGKLVYIANLMTKNGQTHGMTLSEHVEEIARYAGRTPDVVCVNTAPLPRELLARYAEEGEYPLTLDVENVRAEIRTGDFLSEERIRIPNGDVLKRSLIRHNPDKLAGQLLKLVG